MLNIFEKGRRSQNHPHSHQQSQKEKSKKEINCRKPLEEIEKNLEKTKILEAIKKVKDPELDIDIWNLELIYDAKIKGKNLDIKMTFTSPTCPYGPQILSKLKESLNSIGFKPAIKVVFTPLWEPSENLKEMLGISG